MPATLGRSRNHLSRVRGRPCCICGAPAPSDPHHFAGAAGTALKCSDYLTVPLCRKHHDEFHSKGSIAGNKAVTMATFWRWCAMELNAILSEKD